MAHKKYRNIYYFIAMPFPLDNYMLNIIMIAYALWKDRFKFYL